MRGVLAAMKVRGMALYTHRPPHAMPVRLDDIGKRHQRGGAGNALRAGVFGVNDGLVSNAALIYGVAGAAQEPSVIVLTGVAGLLAGAFSMAAGEYVSVRSQREMFEYQIGLERDELETYPDEEAAELALIYAAKGMDAAEARKLADTLMQDPDARSTPWRARARPQPRRARLALGGGDFVAFSVHRRCRAAPLPFLFGYGEALAASIASHALGLFAVGASMSLFTGRHALLSGLRMLGIGGAAGLATWFIGAWLGVALG
jgi:VIT1/CCC1 family predicted Fe2+/Mn2+ transporter